VRHLGSCILAAIFAPSVLILAGRGVGWFAGATAAQPADQLAMLFALAALVLGGLLYALLTLPRLSPLGPVVAGGAYLGVGLWALADLAHLTATVPGELIGLDEAMVSATAAISPLLSVPLLATGYSARRWRGRSAEAGYAAPPPAYPPPPPPPPSYPPPYPKFRPQPYRPTPTVVMPAASRNDQPTEPILLRPAPWLAPADTPTRASEPADQPTQAEVGQRPS
jgi:hypothetical protein